MKFSIYILTILTLLLINHYGYSQFLETVIDKPSPKITSLDARLIMKVNIKSNDTTFYVANTITNDNYKHINDVFVILNTTQKSVQKLILDLELCLKYMNDTKTTFSINGGSYYLNVTYDGYYGSQLVLSSNRIDQFCTIPKKNVIRWIDWLKTVKL